MIVFGCVLIALLCGYAAYLEHRIGLKDENMASERALWASERRELLNRVQAPQFVPSVSEGFRWPESGEDDVDELQLVGTIVSAPDLESVETG